MTHSQWTALGVLASGLLGVSVMTLFAVGRQKEGYALAGAAALTGAVLAAGRATCESSQLSIQAPMAPTVP